MTISVKTNRQFRPLAYREEVPADVLANQFGHLDEEEVSDGFFCYRGHWYHVSDFMRAPEALSDWDGYAPDSYFSGVVIKLDPYSECVMCGTYYS